MPKAKTDNAHLASKLLLRRTMLARFNDQPLRVFDCCQGSGVIWSRLRSEFDVESYWGVDVKPKKGRLKVDSRKVVCQAGLRCNVVDIDTYGMPWDHWSGLLPNIVEPTTVFLTIGLVTNGGGSALSHSVRDAVEIPRDWNVSPVFTPELVRMSVDRFLSMESRGWRVVAAMESTPGPHARYVGARIDRPAA
jgi:hypothetical protein